MPRKSSCLKAARACGEWLMRNQIRWDRDANRGRYLACHYLRLKRGIDWPIDPLTGKHRRTSYSSCWTTVTPGMGLQMLHERTGDEQYVESIRLASLYVKGLQVLDPRHPRRGMFFHNIPQDATPGANRDGTTAAWGLLNFARALEDDDLVERALIYAQLFLGYRFSEEHKYPLYDLKSTEGIPKGHSCNGGEFSFFIELYEKTGNDKWLTEVAIPGLDTYVDLFVNDDGSLTQFYNFRERKAEVWGAKPGALPDRRHEYNDDFGALALMKGYRVTGDRKYLDAAKRFLDWAQAQQHEDGSFGEPKVYRDATPVLIIEMLDMQKLLASRFTGGVSGRRPTTCCRCRPRITRTAGCAAASTVSPLGRACHGAL